jgi:hypothetical protein
MWQESVVLRSSWRRSTCPADEPVIWSLGLTSEGVDTIVINNIHLFCGTVAGERPGGAAITLDAPVHKSVKGSGLFENNVRHALDQQVCPAGQVAVGVHGRSGIWLDAIGLICDVPQLTARPSDGRPSVKAVGRVASTQTRGAPMSICDRARDARERKSPAAAGLETQCRALGGAAA